MIYWTLVRVPPFPLVFQNFPGLRIHTNLLRHGAALDIEGIAQAAANGMGERLNIGNLHACCSRGIECIGHLGMRPQCRTKGALQK
jgi:hypothetical protein